LHLTKPEVGDDDTWKEIGWLGQIGEALHNYFVPRIAERLKEMGFHVSVECSNEDGKFDRTLFGVEFDAKIDLLATNSEATIVFDFKFVHPNVVYTANFPAHRRQVAIYAALAHADYAVLYYVDRTNPTRYNTIVFNAEEIVEILQTEVLPFVNTVKEALSNPEKAEQILPKYSPQNYPCKFKSREGDATCPFYRYCHGRVENTSTLIRISGDPEIANKVSLLVNEYIKVTRTINEVEEELRPLLERQKELKGMLCELLPHNETVTTEEGSLVVKRIVQRRLDTDAVKSLLKQINIEAPMKEIVSYQIQIVKGGENNGG